MVTAELSTAEASRSLQTFAAERDRRRLTGTAVNAVLRLARKMHVHG